MTTITSRKGDFVPEQLKNRVLSVLHILWRQTDENHPITIREILEQLQGMGIVAGRKTISDDIASLQMAGYDIICNKRQQNQYFIGSRDFELPELMMLINAVQAVRFIPPRKRKRLIEKLTAQASQYQGAMLIQQAQATPVKQDANQSIFYMIEDLRMAIAQKSKVTFQYFEYTGQKERVLKHDGQEYQFSPYDLMWSGDLYYVIGFSEAHGKIATFRVDRMTNLNPSDEPAQSYPSDYRVEEYRQRIFQMYEGRTYLVTLRCENSLMNAVVDRFGIDCNSQTDGETHFTVTTEIAISPTFYGWLFQFAGKMEVVAPRAVAEEYRETLRRALKE